MKKMKVMLLAKCFLALPALVIAQNDIVRELEARKTGLPNGWTLTPAGAQLQLGDLPLNLAISHHKKLAAVTNNGQSTQTIELIDIANKRKQTALLLPNPGTAWHFLRKMIYCMYPAGMTT